MVDPDLGLALVFNGTIYNYRELRRDLLAKGYRFFSEGRAIDFSRKATRRSLSKPTLNGASGASSA